MPDPSQMFWPALDDLVSDGTITSAQETAIAEALELGDAAGRSRRQQSMQTDSSTPAS